ncbi:putative methyltransferase DDB_G0268948 isoform X5 [Cuculus canorus]|uniref:putative methyltransferase DDB_G0268948 isoform X5 n=1 Tax=Cuculus canorus TaxID=55661 RepID=UPI0023AAA99F|nr:putative methyltransferase DDB_G0268948 isoform X5 [Cuculus canorus]
MPPGQCCGGQSWASATGCAEEPDGCWMKHSPGHHRAPIMVPGHTRMATQMFEGKGHAAVYQKYRFAPGKELQQTILTYLKEKRTSPVELVVDVGCGSGQGTRFLAEHFKKVVGTDISEAQIQEAKDSATTPNVSYLVSPAEVLPLEDNSVDLITSFTAAHWFDLEKFMREANRVLKPGGCVVLCTYTLDMSLRYGNCSEKLTKVFRESWDQIFKYSHSRVKHVLEDYKEIFEALPFPDKKRITDIFDKIPMTVAGVVGYLESVSPYQVYMKNDPEAAKSLLQEAEKRMLETMGVSSRDTPVELWVRHVCVLGCKGQ